MRPPRLNPVRELVGVWKDTRYIVLIAQTAALYAAVLIPFKVGIPLVPGFSELRPANAIPIVASLLFGPVAAWGAGLGNLIGDCFGTLSPVSLFGFLGNFFYGYIPYLMWGRLGPLSSGKSPEPRSWRQGLELAVVCLVASLVCALVIAWGADLLGLVPFAILAVAIFTNNITMAVLLAPPLLLFLAPRVTRWGLRYEDIGASQHRPSAPSPPAEPEMVKPHEATSPAAGTGEPRPLLDVCDLSFSYAGSTSETLNRLSLTVPQGESMAVMGRTGAGKSTLCYTLNGLIPRHIPGRMSGRIRFDGADTSTRSVSDQSRDVGLLFQEFEAQLISTNIELELAFPLEYLTAGDQALSESDARQRISRTLARVGLGGLEHRDPLSLSGGQRQRLVLASVLVREPKLLVLDEPFTDLDPEGRRTLEEFLRDLRAGGATLMVVEHDPEQAVTADSVCVIDAGRVLWSGKPRTLFGHAASRQLAKQVGVSTLPLADCFRNLAVTELPLTVEEAWQLCDEEGFVVQPPAPEAAPPPQSHTGAMAGGGDAVLDVRRASYGYEGGPAVITDLDLTIYKGEFVAIVGRNGSGKTTLAGLLNGLRKPTRGTVRIGGMDSARMTAGELAASVGYVFQNPDHQIFAETVEDEVSFGMRNLGVPSEERHARAMAALEAVGLRAQEVRNQDPFSLSKGDRQRVAVASVLATRSQILIFDEPTTGLDAQGTVSMMDMLARLNREGHTVVMITHALSLVATYAQRCIVMREGYIEAEGPTRRVFSRLLSPDISRSTGLEVPQITRFASRWGCTLLTAGEVGHALRRNRVTG